jgi:hypothetical protein
MPQVPGPRPLGPPRRWPNARRPNAHPAWIPAGVAPTAQPPDWPLTSSDYERGDLIVIVSVSIVLLLGVLVWFLVRYTALRAWQALVCVLFGFYVAASPVAPYVAASPVAPYVRSAVVAVGRLISGIQL